MTTRPHTVTDATRSAWCTWEGALSGVKVLDLTRILAGPFCTMILADLGADVIKVEDPVRGDDTRAWGPPFVGPDAAYYHSVNRNKRAIAVDLKDPTALYLVRLLARTADVVVENFRPGTAARLGLGYTDLAADNPGLVYASISGFGQTGPMAGHAGYDATAQALSGVMSVTGYPGELPARFGVSGADLGAGMWTTIGILAALHTRGAGRRGQHVDVALLDGQVAWLTYQAAGYFTSGTIPSRHGSAHPNIVPYQAFPTLDGDLMIAAGNDGLWRRFAGAVGLGELTEDPRFLSNADRVGHRGELVALIEKALAARPAAEWADVLTAAGVPVAPVQNVAQALRHPQVLAREMVVEVDHPDAGPMTTLGSPIKLLATPPAIRSASPRHGEHTAEVLRSLGVSDQQIAALEQAGAVTTTEGNRP